MVGQTKAREQLRITIAGAEIRGTDPPHVLLTGPAGYGKTTLAGIVAHTRDGKLHTLSGPSTTKPKDIVGVLMTLEDGDVVFIDEVHRVGKTVQETLYEAMEDRKISMTLGSGNGAKAATFDLAHFVLIGATTDAGKLTGPFRDRFGLKVNLEPYSVYELQAIVLRHWTLDVAQGWNGERAALEVARRSKGVPRVALHLADRVLDYQAVTGDDGSVTPGLVTEALTAFGIGPEGLNEVDLRYLSTLVNTFGCRWTGIDALASTMDVAKDTLVAEHEGNLIRSGYLIRSGQGRQVTPKGIALVRGRA
jgi:Holliday junction DNA helicase RuvB